MFLNIFYERRVSLFIAFLRTSRYHLPSLRGSPSASATLSEVLIDFVGNHLAWAAGHNGYVVGGLIEKQFAGTNG